VHTVVPYVKDESFLNRLLVVSVIGDPVSTLIGLNNCGNINITSAGASAVNEELEGVGLRLTDSRNPLWFDYDEAMKSIKKKRSKLIWLRIEEQVPGCHVVECNRREDSYHQRFILSGVQLKPGTPATVEGETVGALALDENDFRMQVAKLKVLPKNERLKFGKRGSKYPTQFLSTLSLQTAHIIYHHLNLECCKIKGCRTQGRAAKDYMCGKHYNLFTKAGRNTTEGEESENRELTDDGKFAYILEPKLFYNIVCSFLLFHC